MISIIVAMTENRVIGEDNKIPWHLSADLKRFKQITMGYPVIMGRNTFESLERKPLPGRHNIVVRRLRTPLCWKANDLCYISDFDEAIAWAKYKSQELGKDEIFIIGGETIYKQALPITDRIYLTIIYAKFEGDTYFPEIDWSEWHKDQENLYSPTAEFPYSYSFSIFERIKKAPVLDRS